MISIKGWGIGERHAAFVTASPESFRKTIEAAVDTFIAQSDCRFRYLRALGDLARQLLVPQLPPQAAGQFTGNASAPAAKFAFQTNDAKHRKAPSHPTGDLRPARLTVNYNQ